MTKTGFFLFLLLWTGTFLTGCSEEPPMRLSHIHRKVVDSLFRQAVDTLRPQMDSICRLYVAENLKPTVDSLFEVRITEEERLRQRIPKE